MVRNVLNGTFKIVQIFNPNTFYLNRRTLPFTLRNILANALTPVYSVLPVLFIMTVTGIKDAYENYRKERSDDEINSQDRFHNLKLYHDWSL